MTMQKDAIISKDCLYRYSLERTWDTSKERVLFIMLNPSTADAIKPESTERSGESAGTGHHRDGEETVLADMGRSGPVAGLLAVRVAAHEVAVGGKALSLADSCGASGRYL